MSKSRARRTAPRFKRPQRRLRAIRRQFRNLAATMCVCSHFDTDHVGPDECHGPTCSCKRFERAPITVTVEWT